MKKLFTLIAAAMMAVSGFATDYTDQLVVSINGKPSPAQETTITLNKQANGKYEFLLKDFSFGAIKIGDLNLTDVDGAEANGVTYVYGAKSVDVNLYGLMQLTLPMTLRGEVHGDKLTCTMDIDVTANNQKVHVDFGNVEGNLGGFQIPNSGFENFHDEVLYNIDYDENGNLKGWSSEIAKTAKVPNSWHSFMDASGPIPLIYMASAMFDPHTFISNEVRPGSTGKHSVKVVARNAFLAIANGTMTTGRMNTGSAKATDVVNNAWLDMDSTGVDGNNDPFYTVMNGLPDSLSVWVKYNQGTANAEHPYATVSAAITDGTYYQDPQDKEYNNVLASAKNNKIEATGTDWKEIKIPFTVANKDVKGKAILVTISTNADPGQGSDGDSILVDDINLIYNIPTVKGITVKGNEVSLTKNAGKVAEAGEIKAEDIEVSTEGANDVHIYKYLKQDKNNVVATVVVANGDYSNFQTFTITLNNAVTGISSVKSLDNAPAEIFNISGQRVNNMQPGQVYIVKKGGKTVKVMK